MRVEATKVQFEQGRHCVVGIARLRWREVTVHRPGASRSGRHDGRRCVRSARRDASGWDSLTPTECTVAGLVAGACPTGEAGARLFVSRRTGQTHLARSPSWTSPRHAVANRGWASPVESSASTPPTGRITCGEQTGQFEARRSGLRPGVDA